MYYRQKGLTPNLTALLGLIIPAPFLFGGLRALFLYLVDQSASGIDSNFIFTAIESILLLILSWVIPFSLGYLLANMFPALRIVKEGIKQRVWFITSLIRWNEIRKIENLRSGYIGLILDRKGIPHLNGLFFNKVNGRMIRYENPVLFIAPEMEGKNKILRAIQDNSEKY